MPSPQIVTAVHLLLGSTFSQEIERAEKRRKLAQTHRDAAQLEFETLALKQKTSAVSTAASSAPSVLPEVQVNSKVTQTDDKRR